MRQDADVGALANENKCRAYLFVTMAAFFVGALKKTEEIACHQLNSLNLTPLKALIDPFLNAHLNIPKLIKKV